MKLAFTGFELHAFICSVHETLGAIGLNSAAPHQLAKIQFHCLFFYKSPDKTVIHVIKMVIRKNVPISVLNNGIYNVE